MINAVDTDDVVIQASDQIPFLFHDTYNEINRFEKKKQSKIHSKF